MTQFTRRSILKGGSALVGGATLFGGSLASFAKAWAAEMPFQPEAGAKIQVLRWKRFIQSEEDSFLKLVAAFTEATGVPVEVINESLDDIQPKASVAANVGSGPDLVWGYYSLPHLFPTKCVDMTDVADYLGGKYGGWYDSAIKYSTTADGRWISIPMCFGGVFLNYRISAVQAAGFSTFPEDLDSFLALCEALKAQGLPAGMALGHATGDANSWVHWALWSHGAAMVDENDNVTLNSPEAVAACEYVQKLAATFIPGTASWNDGSNNKAFLAGEIGLTNNGISIYTKAVDDNLPMKDDIDHAVFPIGPVGKPTEFHVCYPILAFQHSKFPTAAKAFITFLMEAAQYDQWLEGARAYLSHPLKAYQDNPVWTADPKRIHFRDTAARTLTAGYRGSVGEKAAAAIAEFIIVDMFANVATGAMKPEDAVRDADRKAQRIYRIS